MQYLSQCDEVVFMNEGRILDQGSHNDLMNRNEHYSLLIHTFLREKESTEGDKGSEKNEETYVLPSNTVVIDNLLITLAELL